MIVRGERPSDNFAQIHNAALADGRLSFKARGILAYLLSRPPGWKTSADRLAQSGVDGERAIKSGLKELEEFGYLTRTRTHDPASGTFIHNQIVTDQPTISAKQPDGDTLVHDDDTTSALCTGGKQPDINKTELNNTYLSTAVVEDAVNPPTGDGPQPPSRESLEPPRDAGGWRPSAAALKTADQVVTVLDIEIQIAKYRVRMGEMGKAPSSSEWLRWLLADEQEAKLKRKQEAVEARRKERWDAVAD
ncbi:helix-turn-helix DNA binding domain protein [Arthrobacter phage Pureglobe5]|nr:DNA binding protein [Arthrobacter phage Beagle]QOP66843.1 RepA-like replication initiator [Arthrobacter phage Odyssey395]UYL87457.1 helix-turn-helix DNA binding domain protein [Arthrobacter phage Pureglobe5]